jgi:hypothetical protein
MSSNLALFPSRRKRNAAAGREWVGGRFTMPFEVHGAQPVVAIWMEVPHRQVLHVRRPSARERAPGRLRGCAKGGVAAPRRGFPSRSATSARTSHPVRAPRKVPRACVAARLNGRALGRPGKSDDDGDDSADRGSVTARVSGPWRRLGRRRGERPADNFIP